MIPSCSFQTRSNTVAADERRSKRASIGRGSVRVNQRVDLTAEVEVSSSIEKVGDARSRADQDERDAPKRGR